MIRRATVADVTPIYNLVKLYADRQEMLLRPMAELYEQVRDFFVCEEQGRVVGCARLHISWSDLGEIKSLAVHPRCTGRGLGRALVRVCLDDARAWELDRVFTLTYRPGFFRELGFQDVDKNQLPQKIWNECIRCPEYPSCGEVPLQLELNSSPPTAPAP